ncbi:MAG: hypothetical protein PHH83_04515 [Patescibacteria group bacterium]|nr:hypothetical protein [Patescibacteria group bacterium]
MFTRERTKDDICGKGVKIYTADDFSSKAIEKFRFLPWDFEFPKQPIQPTYYVRHPLYPIGDPIKSANNYDDTGGVLYFNTYREETLSILLSDLLDTNHLGNQYLVFYDECKKNSLQEKYLEQIRIVSPRELAEWRLISKDQKFKNQPITATQTIINFFNFQKKYYDEYNLYSKCGLRKQKQEIGDDALSLGFGICIEASCCCNYRYRIWSRPWWCCP